MTYVIAMLVALFLFVGFLVLTRFEAARNTRIFPHTREKLDLYAHRAEFIVSHVDWNTLIYQGVRTGVATVAHDIAHVTLIAVRGAERLLSEVVHRLQRHRVTAPVEGAEKAVGTVPSAKYLKHGMRARTLPVSTVGVDEEGMKS